MPEKQPYITTGQAGALMGVHARTANRWVRTRKLRGYRTPGGFWLIERASVMEYLRREHDDEGDGEDAA